MELEQFYKNGKKYSGGGFKIGQGLNPGLLLMAMLVGSLIGVIIGIVLLLG